MNPGNAGKIVYLTAGAAGMYCGSCMHDNTLARGLTGQGWDLQLVPTYTPIRTDEADISVDQVFFGGINVYLQQRIPLLRHLPAVMDRILDRPWLIRRVTSRAMEMDPRSLGRMSDSMLKGMQGNQRKEVRRLCHWLASQSPDLVLFSNLLIGGCIPEIKSQLEIPIVVTLQGDDIFLDSLPEPYRGQCISRIRQLAQQVDGFLVHSEFFRSYMADYFEIDPAKILVTPLGIDVADFRQFEPTRPERAELNLGYLARLCPEKGLHHLVDAFIELRKKPDFEHLKLRLAGWMGPHHQAYVDRQFEKLVAAGLEGEFAYLGSVERQDKLKFLASLDLFSVPTEFLEPKGLYALEAMAAGLPIIQPDHGCFPELITASAGGLLFEPGSSTALAETVAKLVHDRECCQRLSSAGRQFVLENRNIESMSHSTGQALREFLAAD
ncbi:MAG: glycosyltransferase family 4 protein [Mariniblastus sp.]|nr:glycosyltransferase family 4 protein [Mariniblastus sp.]